MTIAEILKEKKIPYTKTTDKNSTGYELEEVGGQIYENKDGISFLYSNTELTVPKRFGYLAELVEAYSQGAEPFMEAKAKYLGRNYKNGDKCTTVLDREFAKEEGICIWDSKKNSLEDLDRINDCIAKSFNENYMTIALNEIRQVRKGIKGFKDEEILASSLVNKNEKGQFIDRFRNRLMIPILDVRGKVIAFGGRVLDKSLPKYINSPENIVYSKGRNLFGLNVAKKGNLDKIVIVEGYMDAISLYQRGITNVVASLGTALTEAQRKTS